ncbi:hypothetical protein [Nocardia sp. alder85J]|uniref:hypothetical protein n=1 Tax=Nocardia sp. alder85J TaxID=2862949 RepID=UPI001CD39CD4|nr:hypothetical protein [Nocardia sp. alder85J]MCX4091453.1 hypothetical protein [Nocardia sp. alder85J]
MIEVVPSSDPDVAAPQAGATATAATLSGQLVSVSDRAVVVRVGEGTWTFDPGDIVDIETFGAPADSTSGSALVRVRPGATADFTQRRRIALTERPMTLPPNNSPARGDEQLQQLTEKWADTLHLSTRPGVGGATLTCCQTRSFARSDDGIACDSLD